MSWENVLKISPEEYGADEKDGKRPLTDSEIQEITYTFQRKLKELEKKHHGLVAEHEVEELLEKVVQDFVDKHEEAFQRKVENSDSCEECGKLLPKPKPGIHRKNPKISRTHYAARKLNLCLGCLIRRQSRRRLKTREGWR